MAIRKSQVALHVRVKLNDKFKAKSLSDEYLMQDKVIFIKEAHTYNDTKGEYVLIGSVFNSGMAYLDQLELEFPISDIGTALPTKLDLKIQELEKEIIALNDELGLNASLQKGENVYVSKKTAEGIFPFKEELEKYNAVGEKTKLLHILKELV
jgi:hypothetical protein